MDAREDVSIGNSFRSDLIQNEMLTNRKVFQAEILGARRTHRISIASPSDFALQAKKPVSMAAIREVELLPYCLDFLRRRSVYAGGVDVRAAQQAPFYYLHLRRCARFVVTVPWEAGAVRAGQMRALILLFSPGRCGSTLLSQILVEAGIANVSEPDFYTQATSALCSSPINPLRASVRRAVAGMGHDLSVALAPEGPVIAKLRAESCRAPELLLGQSERRSLFMTRSFESWALSTGRAFHNGPRKTVDKYLRALSCYAYLRRNSDCHLMRYEDLMADPSGSCRALGKFLQVEIEPAAVAAVMKKDSQEGTPLAQGARAVTLGWEQHLQDTLAMWNSDSVKRIRGRLDLAGMGDD